MKRLLWVAAAMLLLVGVIPDAGAAMRGGTLNVGRYRDSNFLDPVLCEGNHNIWILTNIYDTLVRPLPGGKIGPGIATKWEYSPDKLSMTVKLRAVVKYSDGTPLKAEDVKWSIDRARDPKNGVWNPTLKSIDRIEVTGPDMVVFRLKHPDPTLESALATFNAAIMPKQLFEAAPGDTMEAKAKAFAEKPVGSGPFMLTEWKRDQVMRLAPNPHYWEKGEDGKALPYLDGIRFQTIPDDATRILKLKAGEVDLIENVAFSSVAELKANSDLEVTLFPSTRTVYVTLQHKAPRPDGSPNPFTDLRVRQALNYATDKEALIKTITFGIGKPQQSFMSSGTPLYHGEGTPYPYDLAKAKLLMKEAGYANGFEVGVITATDRSEDVQRMTAMQQMWSQINVRLKLVLLDRATFTALYKKGEFDMRASFWTDDIFDPSQVTSYFVDYSNIENLHAHWRNAKVEELFNRSEREMDRGKRAELYKQIQKLYVADAPIVFGYETPYVVAARKQVKGFFQLPLGNNLFSKTYLQK
jgi:peptide/nickel transport system substrate-binding protein